ncbi:MAG: T9SS type A sorting domain-containing protein [Chitinophagales bacterium]
MKNSLFTIVLISIAKMSIAQDIISNGGFEICSVPTCPTIDNYTCDAITISNEGHFFQILDWKGLGLTEHGSGVCSLPDVFNEIPLSQNGHNHYAGIYTGEIIYQEMTQIYPEAFYNVSLDFALGNSFNGQSLSVSDGITFEVWTTIGMPESYNCEEEVTAYGAHLLATGNTPANALPNQWYHFEQMVRGMQFKYIILKVKKVNNCNEYFFFDNVSIENTCCADMMLYQNFNTGAAWQEHLPHLTQRALYIKAGKDVGCPYTLPGDVVVASTDTVSFKAGNFIDLKPGFEVKPGGVFSALTGSGCEKEDPFFQRDYQISLSFFNDIAIFNCTGNWAAAFAFGSVNATHYRVRIFDRWGQKFYDHSDMIREKYNVYWDGSGVSPYISPGSETPSVVELELFNCITAAHMVKTFSILYFYANGCLPHYKVPIEPESHKSSITPTSEVNIFPLPANKQVSIALNSGKAISQIRILDSYGAEVANQVYIPADSNDRLMNIGVENLPAGLYVIEITANGRKFVKQLVVLH